MCKMLVTIGNFPYYLLKFDRGLSTELLALEPLLPPLLPLDGWAGAELAGLVRLRFNEHMGGPVGGSGLLHLFFGPSDLPSSSIP